MSSQASLESQVSQSCRDAIECLQDEREEAELVAVEGDWAYVSIGKVRPSKVNDVFDEDRAHAVIRIPTDFPAGTRPYGIVTIPYVTKNGGQDVDSEKRRGRKARPVEQAMDTTDTGMWSYRWEGFSRADPEDLKKAPEIVRSRFEKE